MNNDYDACRTLYRAARVQERASPADRNAVRMAIATALTASVHVATAGAAATSMASATTAVPSGMAGMTAVGAKGLLQLVLGGKFLSGLCVGAVIGTAVSTTAFVVQPLPQSLVVEGQNNVLRAAAMPNVRGGQSIATPEHRQAEPLPVATPEMTPGSPPAQVALESFMSPSRAATREPASTASPRSTQSFSQRRLTEETLALSDVQDALRRKDSNLALTLLREQERQFPSGQLGEERAAARVLALCGAGRNVEAERARTSFVATYPNSPLAKRVNMGCDH